MGAPSSEVTKLLKAWADGDRVAFETLMPLVYGELQQIAHRYMRGERPDHTLQTTELVHEAYLRLVAVNATTWQDRTHFFAFAAQIMRRILVDAARAKGRDKRGGGVPQVNLNESIDALIERGAELIALDDALSTLAQLDPRKAKVVELRFFGGLSVEETAAALSLSPQSIMRDWKLARAWLIRELSS